MSEQLPLQPESQPALSKYATVHALATANDRRGEGRSGLVKQLQRSQNHAAMMATTRGGSPVCVTFRGCSSGTAGRPQNKVCQCIKCIILCRCYYFSSGDVQPFLRYGQIKIWMNTRGGHMGPKIACFFMLPA